MLGRLQSNEEDVIVKRARAGVQSLSSRPTPQKQASP